METFEELYDRLNKSMLKVCVSKCNRFVDAEDCCMKGWLKVYQSLPTYTSTGILEGWIRRIMVNTCIDEFRRYKVRGEYIDEFITDTVGRGEERSADPSYVTGVFLYKASCENEAYAESAPMFDMDEISELIDKLSPGYQRVCHLHMIKGMAYKDIAEEFNISIGTCKSNIYKAKIQLRKLFKQNYGVTAMDIY